jgi:hypothetical protein
MTAQRPSLTFFSLTEDLDVWFNDQEPHDPNAESRRRLIAMYSDMLVGSGLTAAEGLPRFYAGLRTRCRLGALTSRTYVNYVICGHPDLHPRMTAVRRVRKMANRLAAIEAPPRPVQVETEEHLIASVLRMPEGPVRRAAILMLCTGARCADVARLKAHEIVVHEAPNATTRLEIAWAEQKARKDYGARVTIAYPSAIIGDTMTRMLTEISDLDEAPCPGVKAEQVNVALRVAGVKATTKSFRVRYISDVDRHLRDTNSTTPLHALTGHHSAAIPAAVYRRAHVLEASLQQKRDKARRAPASQTIAKSAAPQARKVPPRGPAGRFRRAPDSRRR